MAQGETHILKNEMPFLLAPVIHAMLQFHLTLYCDCLIVHSTPGLTCFLRKTCVCAFFSPPSHRFMFRNPLYVYCNEAPAVGTFWQLATKQVGGIACKPFVNHRCQTVECLTDDARIASYINTMLPVWFTCHINVKWRKTIVFLKQKTKKKNNFFKQIPFSLFPAAAEHRADVLRSVSAQLSDTGTYVWSATGLKGQNVLLNNDSVALPMPKPTVR